MEGTIIVILKYEGQYEDTTNYVDGVYHVNVDITDFDFDKEYEKYHMNLFNSNGIPAYIDKHGYLRYGEAERGHKMEMRKKLNAFYKEHGKEMSQVYYIEEILKGKKLKFSSVFL
jgi:hypothetical protein